MSRKKKKADFVSLVVLNDGETYSELQGSYICVIPVEQLEKIEYMGGDARDFKPVALLKINDIDIDLDVSKNEDEEDDS